MKKLLYLCTGGAVFYIAGAYRSLPLMALTVTMLAIFLLLMVQVIYTNRNFNISIIEQNNAAFKSIEIPCNIYTENKGMLPVSRFRLRIRYEYRQTPGRRRKKLYGSLDSKSGEQLPFSLSAPYCGLIRLKVDRIQVYDFLAMISFRKKCTEEIQIAVYPREKKLRLEIGECAYGGSRDGVEAPDGSTGDNRAEIRQIREQQPGESFRHVHWIYSARTNRMWVKEYENHKSNVMSLYLETGGCKNKRIAAADAFYEITSALILGLLENTAMVKVYWYDEKQEGLAGINVTQEQQCREVLLALYQLNRKRKTAASGTCIREAVLSDDTALVFHSDLCLYYKNKLLRKFTVAKYLYEMERELLL